jgi:putative FmdB family regulatory protein
MPLYDYECEDGSCCALFETLAGIDEHVECPYCGFSAKRLISVSGVNVANQDAEWIRSVTEVVDKDSNKPATREFLKEPTRKNYHAWMKSEGIRPYEPGERKTPPKQDMEKVYRDVWHKYKERERMSI